jgi:hypothetical protein
MLNPLTALGTAMPVPLINHPTKSLEWYFKEEALVASRGASAGSILINDFFLNTLPKREIVYDVGSPLSNVVANHSVFRNVAGAFEERHFQRILDNVPADADAVRNMIQRDGLIDPPGMPFFTLGDPLGILGSFQEIQVHLLDYKCTVQRYDLALRYILFDHFGCDDEDLEGLPAHGTPGQIAMWLLARAESHGPGHKPFVVRIVVDRRWWRENLVLYRTSA